MKPLSHEQCLELVCGLCTNLNGYKAKSVISEAEAAFVRKHVFPGYMKGSPWFQQGLCVRCSLNIRALDKQCSDQVPEEGQECEAHAAGDEGVGRGHKGGGKRRKVIMYLTFRF